MLRRKWGALVAGLVAGETKAVLSKAGAVQGEAPRPLSAARRLTHSLGESPAARVRQHRAGRPGSLLDVREMGWNCRRPHPMYGKGFPYLGFARVD
jgi:hypothetical protein